MGGLLRVRTASATASPSRVVPGSLYVLSFDSSRGVFAGYDLQSVDSCTVLSAVPTINSFVLLLQISASQVCTPLSTSAIIAISVLSVCGTLAICMIILGVVVWRRRKARRV